MRRRRLTLGPPVNQWNQAVGIALLSDADEHGVKPAARVNVVEPAHDELELAIKVGVKVLDATAVRRDGDAVNAALNEAGRHFGLELANIGTAKEELSVKIGNVNRVHIDDVDVFELG